MLVNSFLTTIMCMNRVLKISVHNLETMFGLVYARLYGKFIQNKLLNEALYSNVYEMCSCIVCSYSVLCEPQKWEVELDIKNVFLLFL